MSDCAGGRIGSHQDGAGMLTKPRCCCTPLATSSSTVSRHITHDGMYGNDKSSIVDFVVLGLGLYVDYIS